MSLRKDLNFNKESFAELIAKVEDKAVQECKRAKVVAAIVDSGTGNVKAAFVNKPTLENGCLDKVGKCGCIHAETQAIIWSLLSENNNKDEGFILCCNTSPCIACANLILLSAKIVGVVFTKYYRDITGIRILRDNGIQVIHVEANKENYD